MSGAVAVAAGLGASRGRAAGHPPGQRGLARLHQYRWQRFGVGHHAQGVRAGRRRAQDAERALHPLRWPGAAWRGRCLVGGPYRDEVTEGVFYPKWYYDQDPIVALGLRETPSPTLKDLGKYRLVWMRGYGYERYLPNVKAYSELQRRAGVLGMLKLGYADFYIDAVAEVNDLLEAVDDRDKYRVSSLTKLPLYVGFADTPKGRSLAELFDRRMSALVTAGRLRPVFSAWGQPYPF